ncbi:cysteine protease ATG4A isoform X1 [Bombina bombina]|uniref:cysteine protease ATG4A isoform X1 n=2 Tax=Bombina bombina TaxID=8345 RepID=UPI00235A9DA1|nr:cysteine protease ATG4A isoform X1 [Bombina bombina]
MESVYVSVLLKYENQMNVLSDYLDIEELPDIDEPVSILGRQYDTKTEKCQLLSDITSRLWFTYRKKFSPIGGTGPSSDSGWGCMLRCGQMMLAQALICQHLGRDWRWEKHKQQTKEYYQILHCFQDRKDCCYSIHQMAQMGVGEGKSIGEWFGPNTVAQVLKKLALFDEWNSLAVYVSMDNTVVIEDIKKMCRYQPHHDAAGQGGSTYRNAWSRCTDTSGQSSGWRPLLLIVPLRLGINHINPVYVDAFKECFKMPQSLGALGGKPNNAYYFIGFSGDELIYLDPHTTQLFADTEEAGGAVQDHTYHCQKGPNRMKILNLDPSVALGFFCKEETDFDLWCGVVEKEILKKQSLRMFELVPKHPPHWPPFIPPEKPEVTTTGAELIESTDKLFDMEEEFEILSV